MASSTTTRSHLVRSQPRPGLIVELNGICGVGKSSFCDYLCSIDPDQQRFVVFREDPDPELLSHFYSDQRRHASGFQLIQQKSCIESAMKATLMAESSNKVCFIDRGALGNATFEYLQHYYFKNISADVHGAYCAETRHLLKTYPVDCVVLFEAPLDDCMQRLESRSRQRNGEAIPDRSYLGALELVQSGMFGDATDSAPIWGEYIDALPPMLRVPVPMELNADERKRFFAATLTAIHNVH